MHVIAPILNLPRGLCHVLVGPNHKTSHRMIAGFVVMTVGVLIAKQAHAVPEILGIAVDMTGYGIHALGATPFIEWMIKSAAVETI